MMYVDSGLHRGLGPRLRIVALLVLVLAGKLPGQRVRTDSIRELEKGKRVAVTVALVNRLPVRNAPAVILRRAAMTPHDVILLEREMATGQQLSAAIWTLLGARGLHGDTASGDAILRVGQATGPASWRKSETRVSERVVERLLTMPPKDIEGVGAVPATELYLPRKLLTGKMVRGKGPDR